MSEHGELIRKVDCVRLPVADLDDGLAFYGTKLGHKILWRTESAAGLSIPDSEAELVLHTEGDAPEVDLKVESVASAVQRFTAAGGTIAEGPVEIAIGQCAIVEDPWGNRLVLLDSSKGLLATDSEGRIIGLRPE